MYLIYVVAGNWQEVEHTYGTGNVSVKGYAHEVIVHKLKYSIRYKYIPDIEHIRGIDNYDGIEFIGSWKKRSDAEDLYYLARNI